MEDKKPVYDERSNYIISQLIKGREREEIAEELKYSSYKSIDMYMRRRNFKWDKYKKIYVPNIEIEKEHALPSSSKIMEIISLLSKDGSDPRTVAKRLGYKDHMEMAEYMKAKGYVYDGESSNYVKETGLVEDNSKDLENGQANTKATKQDNIVTNGSSNLKGSTNNGIKEMIGDGSMDKYLPVLEILVKNQDKLVDLLMPEVETGKIPRYVIGGTFVTKSVHMSDTLDRLVRDFSREKGINQKEIFEVALVEFFKRYGFEAEAQLLINS